MLAPPRKARRGLRGARLRRLAAALSEVIVDLDALAPRSAVASEINHAACRIRRAIRAARDLARR
jgi:hypothetical protein